MVEILRSNKLAHKTRIHLMHPQRMCWRSHLWRVIYAQRERSTGCSGGGWKVGGAIYTMWRRPSARKEGCLRAECIVSTSHLSLKNVRVDMKSWHLENSTTKSRFTEAVLTSSYGRSAISLCDRQCVTPHG